MTETQITIFGAIIAYFILMVAFGLWAERSQTHHGFVIGSREVGYIPTIGSLAAGFRDGMGIMFWFGFAAVSGYGGLWLFIGVLAGLMFYPFVGPRIRAIAAQNNYITVGEMLQIKYGKITEFFTALIIVIFAFLYIAVQLNVSGNIFAAVLGLDSWIGVVSVAVIVGFYLFAGGYSTVVKTDAVQFFLILSLICTPLFFPPPMERITDFGSFFSLDKSTSVGFAGIGFFFVLCGADVWQRVFSARDDKVIRYSFPLAGIFLVIMTLSLIYLGMASAPFMGDDINAGTAFYEIFKGDFIPTPLLAFIAVVVMAICMSTMDTMCYLSAATLAKNIFPDHFTDSRDKYIWFSRIIMVIILVTMSALALLISDVIEFLFSAASLLFILAPVYIYAALDWPKIQSAKTDKLVSAATALSATYFIYLFIGGQLENPLYINYPAILNAVLVGGVLFFRRKQKTAL